MSLEELYGLFFQRKSKILEALIEQKKIKLSGNLYYYTQIQFAYNSNRIEGSKLTEDETRMLYETNTLLESKGTLVDDVFETANHFHLFNVMLDEIDSDLSEDIIKKYHKILLNGTSASYKKWFNVGEYKVLANEVGGTSTTNPKNVEFEIKTLLIWYSTVSNKKIEDLIEFHYKFEKIHPFQDGNGRIGRMILFRECLKNNIVPFIITDEYKAYYYRGLSEFREEPSYLMDTCLLMQDYYRNICSKFLNIEADQFRG
ncbi:MAG: Fic family protein [Bacillota bacterium]|nr:Fic family protein [Bacillota bacterium]